MHLRGPLDGPQMLSYRNKVEFGVFDLVIAAGQISKRLYAAVMDSFVTSPLFRWTWANDHIGVVGSKFVEVRAADHFSIKDMMAGRYVLGHKHIDTQGISLLRWSMRLPNGSTNCTVFLGSIILLRREMRRKTFCHDIGAGLGGPLRRLRSISMGAPNNGATRDQLDQAFRGVDLWRQRKPARRNRSIIVAANPVTGDA